MGGNCPPTHQLISSEDGEGTKEPSRSQRQIDILSRLVTYAVKSFGGIRGGRRLGQRGPLLVRPACPTVRLPPRRSCRRRRTGGTPGAPIAAPLAGGGLVATSRGQARCPARSNKARKKSGSADPLLSRIGLDYRRSCGLPGHWTHWCCCAAAGFGRLDHPCALPRRPTHDFVQSYAIAGRLNGRPSCPLRRPVRDFARSCACRWARWLHLCEQSRAACPDPCWQSREATRWRGFCALPPFSTPCKIEPNERDMLLINRRQWLRFPNFLGA